MKNDFDPIISLTTWLQTQNIWYVAAAFFALGVVLMWIFERLRSAWQREENAFLRDENRYLQKRLNLETRIHERLTSDMVDKFGHNHFRQLKPGDDEWIDDEETQPVRVPVRNPHDPNHFIWQEIK